MADSSFYLNTDSENNNTFHTRHMWKNVSEKAVTKEGNTTTVTQTVQSAALPENKGTVTLEETRYDGTSAVRCRTSFRNDSGHAIVLDTLSSAYITGIGKGGKTAIEDRFVIYYTNTAWQGEAQWQKRTLGECGVYGTYNHDTQTRFCLRSDGSWSTHVHEPFILIEDRELGETWYFETETGTGWYMEICTGGFLNDLYLDVFLSSSYEGNDGWFLTLEPGEEYTTAYSCYGSVKGGFEDAVHDVTQYRRHIMKRHPVKWIPPLCFNDYMDCLWALPTLEKTIPLVDAAYDAGCEYYVMDAGWFGTKGNWDIDLGDWVPNDSLFGEKGLQGIADYVISKGMKPGIWLEIESCGFDSPFAKEHPECLLRRHGKILGGRRCFPDFRCEETRTFIMSVIDRLYGMGYRYIKNDYNQSTGIGVDPAYYEKTGAGTEKAGLAYYLGEHDRAFSGFLDEVYERYPDLIIENCGSGAMRSDMGTVSDFWLQSVSDQEDYFRMPSLISGSEACFPPECTGIWAYPYPITIDQRETFVPNEDFTRKFADGRETAYNMVSGIMGLMYLSGHIDCADGFNKTLIRSATDIYKKYRKNIASSFPVYPDGTFSMYAKGIFSYGLYDPSEGVLILALWSTGGEKLSHTVDLSGYISSPYVEISYPGKDCGTEYLLRGTSLSLSFPCEKSACLFVIRNK